MSLARKPAPRRSSNSEAAGSSTAPEANDVKEAEEDEDEGEVPSPRELVSTLTTEELHEVAAVRKPPKGFVLAMGVLCLLFEETPKWGVARELLKEGDFTKRVLSLQPEVVPARTQAMVRRVVDGNGKRMKLLVVDVKSGHPRAYRVLTLWALAFAAEMQELATAAANEAAAES